MTERLVLDAWALLSLLQGEEPAAATVGALIASAMRDELELHMSMINMGEVYYRVGRLWGLDEADAALASLEKFRITMHPASDDAALAAARWKMQHLISYADAFAVVIAELLCAELVTGDPELLRLHGQIRLRQLHRQRR